MKKSIKLNAVLMVAKTALSLLIPLITFPYISRVLSVDTLGQYNFSSSIVSYFLLIAGLGIGTYAIREGAKIRHDKTKINQFMTEMMVINIVSTVIATIVLIICLLFIPKLHNYSSLIIILGFQILFTLYGRSWIYNVYEDFGYITIIQVFFQFLSMVLLFLLVHKPEDVYKYAIINVISSSGSNILYGIHASKYVSYTPINISGIRKHIIPIFIIFAMSIATTIYVNSDMTILGWIVDDRSVGLYSTAVKIYNIIKQVLVAVITVTIPRLTLLANTDKFKPFFVKVYNMLFFMSIPAMIGIIFLSKNIVLIISSSAYVEASTALQILSVALVFALIACLFGMSVLLPNNKEKIFLNATIVSAIVNVSANFILIPIYKQNAAAFTTALSQAVALVICYCYSKKYVEMKSTIKSSLQVIAGCIGIVGSCILIKSFGLGLVQETILAVIMSILVYLFIELLLRNRTLFEILNSMKGMFLKRK